MSTPTPGVGKMSFGPCSSHFSASGAPGKAARISRMMTKPLAIATLSFLKRIQTCSQ